MPKKFLICVNDLRLSWWIKQQTLVFCNYSKIAEYHVNAPEIAENK